MDEFVGIHEREGVLEHLHEIEELTHDQHDSDALEARRHEERQAEGSAGHEPQNHEPEKRDTPAASGAVEGVRNGDEHAGGAGQEREVGSDSPAATPLLFRASHRLFG
jgi:hypothetical protein